MAKKKSKNVCGPCALNVKAAAIASGTIFGIGFMILGWIAASGYGAEIVNLFGSFYIGYNPGFFGGIIGGVYSFIDWGIAGALVAWLYNKINK